MSEETQTAVTTTPLAAPESTANGGVPTVVGTLLTPIKQIRVYDDAEWEAFVLEWVAGLESKYELVERASGANDQGVDIVGFVSVDEGFAGAWDCYQCKHYESALAPSDAWPEILKICVGTMGELFTWPRRYFFVAPRGVGPTLNGLLNNTANLKKKLIERLDARGLEDMSTSYSEQEVRDFVAEADFSVFNAIPPHAIIDQHSKTKWHAVRFGMPLPPRPSQGGPPDEIQTDEQLYVSKLMDVYAERFKGVTFSASVALCHATAGEHLRRQREAFFSAEALREFAMDSVPSGTFEKLQDDMWQAVIETCDADHASGWNRLASVLERSLSAQISSHLIPRVDPLDRRGICHRLANEDRLSWCQT